jgi:hypothetical protein
MNTGFEHLAILIVLGIVVLVILLVALGVGTADIELANPLGPFLRMLESRQRHRQQIQRDRLQLELVKARRANPDYTAFLERQADEARSIGHGD